MFAYDSNHQPRQFDAPSRRFGFWDKRSADISVRQQISAGESVDSPAQDKNVLPPQNPQNAAAARYPTRTSSFTRGFTLLEMLLAIAITGLILTGAVSLVVSVSNIWSNRQESHFFEEHVDGVTEFLQASFRRAGVAIRLEEGAEGNRESNPDTEAEQTNRSEPENPTISVGGDGGQARSPGSSAEAAAGLTRVAEEPIRWTKPPGFAAYEDPLLNFTLSRQPPLLVDRGNGPAVGVEAFLHFDPREGLSLLWYSKLQEEAEDLRDLRRTELSRFVESIRYVYWDERFERWEEEPEPREDDDGALLLPRYIRLAFDYEGAVAERTIAIPPVSRQAILF